MIGFHVIIHVNIHVFSISMSETDILLYKVISFFLSVAKDLDNRSTDMVLLYNEAYYRYREGF